MYRAIAINKYEDGDFTFVFFGTDLVNNIGYERTGAKVLELTNHTRKEVLFDALMEIHTTKETLFAAGNSKKEGREHKKWEQVKMPLRRNGKMNEVLSFIVFKPYEE